jgi:hypothetical protein
MKRILWLVHPLAFEEKDAVFPAYLAGLINGKVTAVFLDAGIYEHIPLYSNSSVFPTMDYNIGEVRVNEEKQAMAEQSRTLIRDYFAKKQMDIEIHENDELSYDDLVEESRFADILLTNISLSYFEQKDNYLSPFVKNILLKAQCPVLIVPDDLQEISEIFFTYNGSYSSVYSIRQFIYLFESLHGLPVTVIYVQEGGEEEGMKYKKMLQEMLSGYFSDITFKMPEGNPEAELLAELMYKKNAIATFGAFSRNRVSRFLHRSEAENVIQTIDVPVFITHP